MSPGVTKLPARYTPSPTKLDSPRMILNNNQSDNGNVLQAKNNANLSTENGGKISDPALLANSKAAYLCVKADYTEDILSKAEFKQLLQIGGNYVMNNNQGSWFNSQFITKEYEANTQ